MVFFCSRFTLSSCCNFIQFMMTVWCERWEIFKKKNLKIKIWNWIKLWNLAKISAKSKTKKNYFLNHLARFQFCLKIWFICFSRYTYQRYNFWKMKNLITDYSLGKKQLRDLNFHNWKIVNGKSNVVLSLPGVYYITIKAALILCDNCWTWNNWKKEVHRRNQ